MWNASPSLVQRFMDLPALSRSAAGTKMAVMRRRSTPQEKKDPLGRIPRRTSSGGKHPTGPAIRLHSITEGTQREIDTKRNIICRAVLLCTETDGATCDRINGCSCAHLVSDQFVNIGISLPGDISDISWLERSPRQEPDCNLRATMVSVTDTNLPAGAWDSHVHLVDEVIRQQASRSPPRSP